MPRPKSQPEPFYRSARKAWFLQLGKKQIKLGTDKQEAWRRYYQVMAEHHSEDSEPEPPRELRVAVEVIDLFLDWVQRRKSPRTYEWYLRHCQAFAESIGPELLVSDVKPRHLTELCDRNERWSPTTKHALCRAVQRAFRWAEQQGYIARSPLGSVEKPEPESKDVLVTPAEYAKIMRTVKEPNFRDLLRMAWESGMRPQELRLVEAKHLDAANGRFVFPPKEAKGKKLPRVVYLTDEALEIARSQAEKHPTGPMFRNEDGRPWHRWAINCAFIRLQKKIGKKFHLGAFRKSFATEALKNGVDPITASHLLGHRDTNMIARVYARLSQDSDYLRDAAKRARGQR